MEKPDTIKDKSALAYIEYLENKLELFTKSPYTNSYIALKRMVDRGNLQLEQAGNEDIDFDSDKFKAISKFALQQKDFLDQLDYFRSKMTPPEQKVLDEQMKQGAGIAEKVAMKHNGTN